MEYHANEFAGRLLVPLDDLKTAFEQALAEVEKEGMPRRQLNEASLAHLCNPLAKHFAVSQNVIERRLTREKLWPLL